MGTFFPCSYCVLGSLTNTRSICPDKQFAELNTEFVCLFVCLFIYCDPAQEWNTLQDSASWGGDKASRGVATLPFKDHSGGPLASPK